MNKTQETKIQVLIDKNKCIGCGLCKKDCVGMDIDIIDSKAFARGLSCIKCGHCQAICPQNAIELTGYEDSTESFEQQVRLDPNQLLMAIKTRRTIRNFTKEEVSKQVIDQIFEAGRLAPTGTNAQGTSFILLENKKAKCEEIAVKTFRKLISFGKIFIPALKSMNIDDNFFFKGAPLVIIVCGKDKVSASLAAENMAFMAEANGLGVLFSGFFTACFNNSSKIRKLVGVKKDTKAATCLVIGHAAVNYHRTVHRNALKLIKA